MISSTTSSSVALAVGQGGDLVLQALQLLGRGDLAGVEPLLVALGARPDLVDVALGLGQLAAEVALLGLGLDQLVAQHADLLVELGQQGVLGQRAAPVGELVDLGVQRLHVEQALLVGGGGFQRDSSLGTAVRADHGSVTSRDTRVSTVSARSPSPLRSRRSQSASQGHSLAQWLTSTRPGAPCSSASDAGWCRRSAVT